ncbi:hypothetical protein DFH27DRAFT_519580 [Peziza echinospora]|nr:hypothetical protein DFH27DRAFT_519580 [Peziza echinospora]
MSTPKTFRKYLPLDGRENICNDVLQCVSDEELRALSQNLLTAILIPMKARGKTPAVTPSPRFGAEADVDEIATEIETSTRAAQAWLKTVCLRRDRNRCIITHAYDAIQSMKLPEAERDSCIAAKTEVAHIIPFSLGHFGENETRSIAIIWDAMYRYFPSIRSRVTLSPQKINEPWNAMTMITVFHDAFGEFSLALEPTSTDDVYRIQTYPHFQNLYNYLLPPERQITLVSDDPRYLLPNRYLLETHAAIAKILHISGAGEYVERVIWDFEQIACLAEDGSTNLQELMMVADFLTVA